ncbi:GDSL-type esterase/lipase family protein [Paenibacillus puldeungensis]|uniref:GDSL-type esterase/lipase family protein n=1 Tax=Paenibacillus puldeungensis TaxID=696536 RepID=A0ABW3RTN6_9BACL
MNVSADLLSIPVGKRIVFLGDSITENGTYIRDLDAFFLKHLPQHRLEWINLGVSSETAAGTSEASHPFPRPCVHERLERALQESKPDWVFICYGMNDGIYHPYTAERFEVYREGMCRAAEKVRQAGARLIWMTPPPFDISSVNGEVQPDGAEDYSFDKPFIKYNEVLGRYATWVREYADEQGETVVDIRKPLMELIGTKREANSDYRYGDGIHPEEDGHWVIARTTLSTVFHIELERSPEWAVQSQGAFIHRVEERRALLNAAWREHVGHSNPNKLDALPLPEALERAERMLPAIYQEAEREGGTEAAVVTESWKGYSRVDFYHVGRECVLVAPKTAAPGRPWIWRCEFFDAFADADMALLEQGWHLAYFRISNLYGCSYAVEQMEGFRSMLTTKFDLNAKPVLFGFSRGGLYALRYAAMFPQNVAAMYLDAPVVDIRSWPGGAGAGLGSAEEWKDCLSVYRVTDEEKSVQSEEQGQDEDPFAEEPRIPAEVTERLLKQLAAPAEAGVPILLVSGDADRHVPFPENGAVLKRTYNALGGRIDTILKPGGDHHPHSLPDVRPIVEFILSQALK